MRQIENRSLFDLLKSFRELNLVLPHFQREFVWTLKDIAALLASIILDYPIGGFLVNTGFSGEFFLKIPESRETDQQYKVKLKKMQRQKIPVEHLLDGQQRITSLDLIFSEYYSNEEIPLAKRPRWFLDLEHLGFENLIFPDLEKLIAETVIEKIIIQKFVNLKKKGDPYHPDSKQNVFIQACVNDKLLPIEKLFSEKDAKTLPEMIIDVLSTDRLKVVHPDYNNKKPTELNLRVNAWTEQVKNLCKQIMECVVPVEKLKTEHLLKVAGVFEVVNKSGQDLQEFDLMLARHYNQKKPTIGDQIKTNCKIFNSQSDLEVETFFDLKSDVLPELRHVPSQMKHPFLQILAILNILSKPTSPSIEFNKKAIFSIESKFVFKNQADCIDRLLRACTVLNLYMGVPNFKYIPYEQMLLPLATVLDTTTYNNVRNGIHGAWKRLKLQKWYFGSIFSGKYQKAQDRQATEDVKDLITYLSTKNETSFFGNAVFNTPGYSDFDALKEQTNDSHALSRAILQFILAKTPNDLYHIHNNIEITQLLVTNKSLLLNQNQTLFLAADRKGVNLEVDHIIPFSWFRRGISMPNIIRKDNHPVNSILNKIWISDNANQYWSNLPPNSKIQHLQNVNGAHLHDHLLTTWNWDPTHDYDFNLSTLITTRFQNLQNRFNTIFNNVP